MWSSPALKFDSRELNDCIETNVCDKQAIAKQVGIIESEAIELDALREAVKNGGTVHHNTPVVIKGIELDSLKDSEWDMILKSRQIVFARYFSFHGNGNVIQSCRTTPEQKLMIVENCQKRGEIVAVTGDGGIFIEFSCAHFCKWMILLHWEKQI